MPMFVSCMFVCLYIRMYIRMYVYVLVSGKFGSCSMHACAHVCEYISVCVYVYVCARVCRNTGGVFNKVVPLVVADFVFDPCRLLFRAGRLSYMCFVCVCVCVCVCARAF